MIRRWCRSQYFDTTSTDLTYFMCCYHPQDRALKKSDGKRVKHLSIPKLDDANWAGGERSGRCTLILTEGDSAKALAISGLSVVGRD